MSDAYSFDSDAVAPSEAQRRRRLLLQRLQLAANATPGQTASAPAPQSIPSVDPSAAPVVQAPAGGGMLEALRVANAAPSAAVAPDQSAPGTVPVQPVPPQIGAPQPAAGGMLQALRDALHNKIDSFVDSQEGFDENGKAPASLRAIANVDKVLAGYVPGPVSEMVGSAADSVASKQALKDALHTGVDTALDPATRSRVLNSVGRGVQQGLQASMRASGMSFSRRLICSIAEQTMLLASWPLLSGQLRLRCRERTTTTIEHSWIPPGNQNQRSSSRYAALLGLSEPTCLPYWSAGDWPQRERDRV